MSNNVHYKVWDEIIHSHFKVAQIKLRDALVILFPT